MNKEKIEETTQRLEGFDKTESALIYGVAKGMEIQKTIEAIPEDEKPQDQAK